MLDVTTNIIIIMSIYLGFVCLALGFFAFVKRQLKILKLEMKLEIAEELLKISKQQKGKKK